MNEVFELKKSSALELFELLEKCDFLLDAYRNFKKQNQNLIYLDAGIRLDTAFQILAFKIDQARFSK